MIISHKKKFIFIHIYKTGGTSVTSLFAPYARFIEKISTHYYLTKNIISVINKLGRLQDEGNKWINGVHKHAKAVELQEYIGRDLYSEYFKFAFVRNPYDLQVSLYHYIKDNKGHRDHQIANKLSFEDFVLREIKNKAPLQSDFLINNGSVIIDFIGKTENLDDDLKKIANILDVDYESIGKLNQSKRLKNYRLYYSDKLKKQVYKYYQKDFELLRYDSEI